MKSAITALFFFLGTFVATSVAAAQGETLGELAGPIYEAITGGQYFYAAAMGVVLIVALTRRYGGSRIPWLANKLVAPILVLLASFAGAVATSMGAGEVLSTAMLWSALKIAIIGAGGYAMLKPYFTLLASISPAWAKPLFVILELVFKSKDKAAKAKAAGDAAVAAKPAKGTEIAFRDIE